MSGQFVFADPEFEVPEETTPTVAVAPPAPGVFEWKPWAVIAGLTGLWFLLWRLLIPFSRWVSFELLGLTPGSRPGEAVAFFLYDTPKILLLLAGMIFLITVIRSFFSTEQTRRLLGGKREGVGNVLAAGLGVVTPFCSCSAVPLFIGFVESGIPMGVTFSYLIAAPMVNEIALVMLLGMFGWRVAGLYVTTGLFVAIIAGYVIGRMPHVERGVEDFVWQLRLDETLPSQTRPTWAQRFRQAGKATWEIVGKVWPYVIAGIAVGAAIHGFVAEEAMAGILGKDAWWSVPAGVLIGIPMYSSAAGIVPVVQALTEKGAALGTVLAFMMSVVALSLPEMILLRRVLKPRLIALFIAVVGAGILLVGFLFNVII